MQNTSLSTDCFKWVGGNYISSLLWKLDPYINAIVREVNLFSQESLEPIGSVEALRKAINQRIADAIETFTPYWVGQPTILRTAFYYHPKPIPLWISRLNVSCHAVDIDNYLMSTHPVRSYMEPEKDKVIIESLPHAFRYPDMIPTLDDLRRNQLNELCDRY